MNGLEKLENQEAVQAIESFVEKQDLKLEGVYLFEASEWTDTLDVSVHFMGDEVQVVVWDTTLKELTNEEIVYIVANEFYALENGRSAIQLVILVALSHVVFFVTSRVLQRIVPEDGYGRFETVPVSWAALLLAMFIIMPVMNNFDRNEQLHVDQLALEAVEQPEVAVEALKKMSLHQPVQLNESLLFDIFGTSRVSLLERLENITK